MSFQTRHLRQKKKRKIRVPLHKLLTLGVALGRPLYALGKKMYERKQQEARLRKVFTVGAAFVVVLAIVLLTFSLLLKVSGFSMGSLMKVTGTPVGVTDDGITNILLLGEGDETGQNLIDTIIIASLDPVNTKSISLLSLPRDLYFLHTDYAMKTEKGKINALWRDNAILYMKDGMKVEAAGNQSLKDLSAEIGNALGIPIHHAIKVDFEAFEKVIDAIGGIDVDVPETIHDTEFPGPNYTYTTFHIDSGPQHLDGATALKYARTRSTTSDFDRSSRQQQILRRASEKLKKSGLLKKPRKIMELYSILAQHVQTDLQTRQLVTLAGLAKELKKDRFISLQVNNVNGLYGEPLWKAGLLYAPPRGIFDGDSVLLPVSIPEFPVTWKQMKVLTHLFFSKRNLYLPRPTFAVLNGGAPEGTASKVSRELTKFGFDVVRVRNVPGKRNVDHSFVTANSEDSAEVATFFSSVLSVPKEALSDEMKGLRCEGDVNCLADEFGTVTIILGEDFEFKYFQDLVDIAS